MSEPGSRGVGDRWLAGETVPGVEFRLHDRVQITTGRHAGAIGGVVLLTLLHPEPSYLVSLGGGITARARQSALRVAS
jgi:hypothetical protein